MKNYLFIDQNIEELKKEIYTTKASVFKRLVEQCKRYEVVQLSKEHPNGSTTFMGIAIANLALAFVLTKNEKYLVEAKRWIFKVVNYKHWGNAHLVDVDLSAAWILFGLSIGYDWLKDELDEKEKGLVQEKLILQANRMYEFKLRTEGSGWSTNYFQNHNWINMTGLATAGYALKEEYQFAKDWITSAKNNFETVYSMLPGDGSDYEGVVYWRYGAMWLFVYAHLLKERERIDYFQKSDFLRETFFYRLYQAAPNLEEIVNFGDCHDRRSGHSTAIYYKVASEYKNGYAQKLGNLVRDKFLYREAYESKVKPGILPECFFEVLFYNPKIEEKDFSELPLKKFFPDLGLYVVRSSWDLDATHLSFKCGIPGGKRQWENLWNLKETKGYDCFGLSHQHPDNNSFILISKNNYYAIDDGYNRNVKASDHNIITVDDLGYQDEGGNNIWKNYLKDMVSDIEICVINDSISYLVGEASKQYDSRLNLISYKRHIVHITADYFIMIDEMKSKDEHIYSWRMNSDMVPKTTDYYTYQGDYGEMRLYQFSDVETTYDLSENIIRAVMTTQEPDKFTENKMKVLKTSNINKAKQMTFFTVFDLTNQKLEVTKVPITDGIAVKIRKAQSTIIYVFGNREKLYYKEALCHKKLTIFKEEGKKIVRLFDLGDEI